ncbi:hypothetical protein BSK66_27830 [Paenibacillus odorifer]|uniref:hypothetical protein n=1 Tax=Paenibacillus TaxID=44249 RepID=UPI0003E259FB|nr:MULTISPECIES: hypothetical protein [Paenibacillus]ETT61809.1 hypothetical protein C171_11631 [Paenibacillus sp. FSL H8-237]OMD13768.1 hypothetical protein BJP47_24380 [Paenibacillus odorifer]OME48998.1 hypothetical protein BSK66_27830 [Paenibacillus odorifer]
MDMKKLMQSVEENKADFYEELHRVEDEQLRLSKIVIRPGKAESIESQKIMGSPGKGKELKTAKIWCEKEFGIKLPEELGEDKKLYTHKEVWTLLDQYKKE